MPGDLQYLSAGQLRNGSMGARHEVTLRELVEPDRIPKGERRAVGLEFGMSVAKQRYDTHCPNDSLFLGKTGDRGLECLNFAQEDGLARFRERIRVQRPNVFDDLVDVVPPVCHAGISALRTCREKEASQNVFHRVSSDGGWCACLDHGRWGGTTGHYGHRSEELR